MHGAWLFPAALLNSTLRLLLAYGLSGQFLNAIPDYSPNALLSEGLSFCPEIRTNILQCLSATLQSIAKETQGLVELALAVFEKGLVSPILNEEGRQTCSQAICLIDNMLRPVVPPLVKSATLRQATSDLTGGSVSGKKADYVDLEEPSISYADVQEGTLQQTVSQTTQPSLSGFHAAGLTRDTASISMAPAAQIFTSAAPSAKDVNMVAFGKPAAETTENSPPSPAALGGPSSGGLASNDIDGDESVGRGTARTSSKRSVDALAEQNTAAAAEPVEKAGEAAVDDEEEPVRVGGGGRQAELAKVKWDQPEDSDTSDDDAPMPTIHMSDSEDDEDDDE